ncbi:MAG TPA: glycosyltransferase family 2 protein [Syntrophales bacterium]|nr:glycosyltransferase family 2 protein [Syntrophales bacterium]HOM08489.1 glycosyltransferase family 2 protein [Syntrophales bacterium]HOO01049.1 glycosyltransferase family 2 protein [Syntrophales bacterium]HPC02121.1 glycosyltransferase family 2 protein [Syntrophales bacterium]HPQ07586.1 glycosyltransferase family 2 protein [Syntrophales bacterium]
MDLSVIVVSYNTADLIRPCLSSVLAQDGCETEVFVVDNASTDGGGAVVAEHFPTVRLMVNEVNRGFAAANNQALPYCRGRYVLFLNPDTVVEDGALAAAVAFMDRNPDVGLAGLHILNPDGTDQESVSFGYPGRRFASRELEGLPGEIAAVLGAAMIVPREVLAKVGGFDEDFFLYGEDEDLCLRIRKLGLKIGFIPHARVVHHHGQSERGATKAAVWRRKTRAEILFYRKHYRSETIAAIRRAELWKARWRLLTLTLTVPFVRRRAAAREKRERYRIRLQELKGL